MEETETGRQQRSYTRCHSYGPGLDLSMISAVWSYPRPGCRICQGSLYLVSPTYEHSPSNSKPSINEHAVPPPDSNFSILILLPPHSPRPPSYFPESFASKHPTLWLVPGTGRMASGFTVPPSTARDLHRSSQNQIGLSLNPNVSSKTLLCGQHTVRA